MCEEDYQLKYLSHLCLNRQEQLREAEVVSINFSSEFKSFEAAERPKWLPQSKGDRRLHKIYNLK